MANQVQQEASSKLSPAEELGKAGTLKLREGDNEGAKNAQARADLEEFLAIGKDEAALKMARSALQNLNR